MRELNKFFEKGLIISFISIIIFTSGFLISLIVIPFLHPIVETPQFYILIYRDSDFEKYNCIGSGTASDPYIIENYTYQEHGLIEIEICGVEKYFIVRNNIIVTPGFKCGIHIANVPKNISIINNTVYGSIYNQDSGAGISLYNLNECRIFNNTVISKEKGIQVEFSTNCSIQNNILIKNEQNIDIWYSSHILIENNYITCNEKQPIYSTIDEELFGEDSDALFVGNSHYMLVKNNQIYNGGLFFYDDSIRTATIENNFINDGKIGFFKNLTNFLLNSTTEFSQILLVDCINCSLYNLNLSDVNIAIGIYNSNFINCSNSNLSNTVYAGLYIYDSLNVTISESTFFGNHYGACVKYSSVHFHDNVFQNNSYGLYIINSNCTFVNNIYIDNVYYDIYPYGY